MFKEGYCEQVVFEVSVSSAEVGTSVYLNPVAADKRNEPVVQLGNNHHLEIISLVEKYKQCLK